MSKHRFYRRDEIIPCSQTECAIKNCPNYSKKYQASSFFFPSCTHNPNRLHKTKDANANT